MSSKMGLRGGGVGGGGGIPWGLKLLRGGGSQEWVLGFKGSGVWERVSEVCPLGGDKLSLTSLGETESWLQFIGF